MDQFYGQLVHQTYILVTFFLGHLKQIVYETPVNTVEELTVRVNNAAESIRQNSDMLVRSEHSSFYGSKGTRARIDNGGRHSHLLRIKNWFLLDYSKFLSSFAFNVLEFPIKLIKILFGFSEIFRKNGK
jgi:hypothetical protein